MMMWRGKHLLSFSLLICIIFTACKKEHPDAPLTGTRTELTLDSIYLYARQIYLWNDVLPAVQIFNPRKYASVTPEITALTNELFDISQLKINPATGTPYEAAVNAGNPKYSYVVKGINNGSNAAVGPAGQPAVLKTAVLNSGGKKVGYIALGSFPVLNSCKTDLDNAFLLLAAASPQQLVIDLRSNGGGFVETAEYVVNLVANTALNGKLMFTEQYNVTLQNGQADILKNQPYLDENGQQVIYKGRKATLADVDYTEAGNTHLFSKKGTLETVGAVYFLVSSRTASASELLISSLKPYLNTTLAGEKTYGKPVGFFPVHMDTYSVYLSSFLIRNSAGWSDYFTGIPADIEVVSAADPVLGDPQEPVLNAALAAINRMASNNRVMNDKGSSVIAKDRAFSTTIVTSSPDIAGHIPSSVPFQMIENRLKLKK